MLKVDSVQNQLFGDFIHVLHKNEREEFSKDDLTGFVFDGRLKGTGEEKYRSSSLFDILTPALFGSGQMITLDIAQNIAELIIARAERNKVIELVSSNMMSETYKIKNFLHPGINT